MAPRNVDNLEHYNEEDYHHNVTTQDFSDNKMIDGYEILSRTAGRPTHSRSYSQGSYPSRPPMARPKHARSYSQESYCAVSEFTMGSPILEAVDEFLSQPAVHSKGSDQPSRPAVVRPTHARSYSQESYAVSEFSMGSPNLEEVMMEEDPFEKKQRRRRRCRDRMVASAWIGLVIGLIVIGGGIGLVGGAAGATVAFGVTKMGERRKDRRMAKKRAKAAKAAEVAGTPAF